LTLACAGLLEPRGRDLNYENVCLMLKISFAGLQVVLVSLHRFHRNSLLKCVLQPKNAKNLVKTLLLGVQGHSVSSMLIKLKSPWTVLVVISNMSLPICNCFHTRQANSGKITFFLGGTPLWCPRLRGTPSPRGTKFCHENLSPWGSPQWRFRASRLHCFDTDHECDDRQTNRRTPWRWLRRVKH